MKKILFIYMILVPCLVLANGECVFCGEGISHKELVDKRGSVVMGQSIFGHKCTHLFHRNELVNFLKHGHKHCPKCCAPVLSLQDIEDPELGKIVRKISR